MWYIVCSVCVVWSLVCVVSVMCSVVLVWSVVSVLCGATGCPKLQHETTCLKHTTDLSVQQSSVLIDLHTVGRGVIL